MIIEVENPGKAMILRRFPLLTLYAIIAKDGVKFSYLTDEIIVPIIMNVKKNELNATWNKYTSIIVSIVFLIGLACYFLLFYLSPGFGYDWDHFDNIAQGIDAEKYGLLDVYSLQPEDLVAIKGQVADEDGRFSVVDRTAVVPPNYPPLMVCIHYLQVQLLERPVFANTFSSRFVMGFIPMLAALILAIGLFFITINFASRRQGLIAACMAWLMPPIMMNTALWGQVDILMLSALCWVVWAMIKRKWLLAGFLFAVACLLKPQALIFAPVALFGILIIPGDSAERISRSIAVRSLQALLVFSATIVVVTLPWFVSSGSAWVNRCYVSSFLDIFPYTTLHAYNIWYLDLLINYLGYAVCTTNSAMTWLAFSKDTWGYILTAASLIGFMLLCYKKFGRSGLSLLVYCGLWLTSVFMLPTRIHERFIVYCIPFIILLVPNIRMYWIVLCGILITGVAEHSWHIWDDRYSAQGFDPARSYASYVERNNATVTRQEKIGYKQYYYDYKERYGENRPPVMTVEFIVTIVSISSYVLSVILVFGHKGASGNYLTLVRKKVYSLTRKFALQVPEYAHEKKEEDVERSPTLR